MIELPIFKKNIYNASILCSFISKAINNNYDFINGLASYA